MCSHLAALSVCSVWCQDDQGSPAVDGGGPVDTEKNNEKAQHSLRPGRD